ncbi:MAG: CbbQ/NirQ/NorQ/GpvN family protein [Candidatus Tectomicrobia bacterium]|nr:CbbQ/NirQ/NorQ/GpvN family protein [Candidatus Tectomicrobia bacterium]
MTVPYYRPIRHEVDVFHHAYRNQLGLMLKGPTGCGKSRFVEAMASSVERPLITVACHDDTSATDLLGRYLVQGGDTVWQDGPLTRAVREGAILYLDEIAEAREDVVVVLHSLTDHRRQIFLDRLNETLTAPPEFMLIISFNPGYQRGFKELKPSTRQRFVGLSFQYPEARVEAEIVARESGVDDALAQRLVTFATKVRNLEELGLSATASTRLLVHAGRLVQTGMAPRTACQVGIIEPLTDEVEIINALQDTANLIL